MKDCTTNVPERTIGLDLGDKWSYLLYLDREGRVKGERRVRTTERALEKNFCGLNRSRVVLEVGVHSPWVSRCLERCGHEVVVANPRRIPLIYKSVKKTDRTDAECLARLGRVDPALLHPVKHRGKQAQQDLAVLRSRDILVRTRTKLISHARSLAKSLGVRFPRCSAQSFARKVQEEIPRGLGRALEPVVGVIQELTVRIGAFDRQIEQSCEESYPETNTLRQVRGVGPVTALAYILTLEDAERFPRSRSVGPYLGLIPRRDDSGQRESQLRISKAGDSYLRRLLVGCSQYILGPFGIDSDLRRYGERLSRRGGKNAKKRAVVAVARKLAVLLHRLWRTGELYDELWNTKRTCGCQAAG